MYRRLRTSADVLFGRPSAELERYSLEYQREFHRFGRISSKKELLTEALRSEITLCGDYHTLDTAQKTALDLLSSLLPELSKKGHSAVLALEMLPFAHNEKAERFLAGSISETKFLKAIGFRESWGFEWRNYRPLFAFARESGVRVVGLNGPSPRGDSALRTRDRFAARVLADLSAGHCDLHVFALLGDLHLAREHLPRDLRRALIERRVRRRVSTIHQNAEPLYWKRAELGLESGTEVVRLGAGNFCLLNTPPWVKLHSLVRWGELVAAGVRPDDPPSEAWRELDFAEEVAEWMAPLQRFLGIEGPVDTDFRVCGPSEVRWLARRRGLDGLRREVTLEAIGAFDNWLVPGENLLFLSDFRPMVLAEAAARVLHAQLSGFGGSFLDPRADFSRFLWAEAVAFLGSKIAHPQRPAPAPALVPPRLPSRCRSARGLLRHLTAAKKLGALVGEGLFRDFMAGRLDADRIRSLFENPFSHPARNRAMALPWLRRLGTSRS